MLAKAFASKLAPTGAKSDKENNMGYAELIEKLQKLPEEKQSEVFDFVEFLASRSTPYASTQGDRSQSVLSRLRAQPIMVRDFSPMSRDEANVR